MMNKKEKTACCKKDSNAQQQERAQFTPFTSLRKSIRRLKQRKVKQALSIDSLLVDAPPNKKTGETNDKHKCKKTQHADGKDNTRNILKRFTLEKRSRNKDKVVDTYVFDHNRFSIVEWSSCESLAGSDRAKTKKHNSLRRSRASLFVPTDGLVQYKFISPTTKITRYNSLDQIDQTKIPLRQNKWHSTQNVTSSGTSPPHNADSKLDSEMTSAAKRKKMNSKRVGHSLSLPNINENKNEYDLHCEIDIDIGENDNAEEIENVEVEAQLTLNTNTDHGTINRKLTDEPVELISQDKACVLPSKGQKQKFSVRLYNKSMCISTPALNRPPIPSAPKPISRRDRILKSASTEGLTSKKYNRTVDNYFKAQEVDQTSSTFNLMSMMPRSNMKQDSSIGDEQDADETFGKPAIVISKNLTDVPDFLEKTENVWTKSSTIYQLPLAIAEAVWDQTSLNDDELMFSSGDVINVLFMEDEHWWWGARDDQEGWFPASYVRLRVVQETYDDTEKVLDMVCKETTNDQNICIAQAETATKEKLMAVRAKCVEELLNTEKDYLKLLKNIIEGYLHKVRADKQMFTTDDANILFGNIEELYSFHKMFLQELQDAIILDKMEASAVGEIFVKNYSKFEIYSQYCNNQPRSSSRLSMLTKEKKYKMFFETCRLRQNMIRLSLDGFLLSPVQRICKYPLQLKELLKHTRSDHEDFSALGDARKCMQNVASLINERKRRLENVNKLARWQLTISNWRGDDVVTRSGDLLHKGLLRKVSSGNDVERVVFLFDHQLIYLKRDFSKRGLTYCGRIDLDSAIVENVENNSSSCHGEVLSNAWRVFNSTKKKWYYFYADNLKKKEAWLKAHEEERKHVIEEVEKGFIVTPEVRTTAMENAYKRHIAELKKGRMRRKSVATYHAEFDATDPYSLKAKYSNFPTSYDDIDTVRKRVNKPRRNRSFRLSLQGTIFVKNV